MTGSDELPGPGDTDGSGTATVSFAKQEDGAYEVCWDMAYTGIANPTAAHIHPGAAGVANPPVIDFGVADAQLVQGVSPQPGSGSRGPDPCGSQRLLRQRAHQRVPERGDPRPIGEGPEPAGSIHFLPTPLLGYDPRGLWRDQARRGGRAQSTWPLVRPCGRQRGRSASRSDGGDHHARPRPKPVDRDI